MENKIGSLSWMKMGSVIAGFVFTTIATSTTDLISRISFSICKLWRYRNKFTSSLICRAKASCLLLWSSLVVTDGTYLSIDGVYTHVTNV